MNRIANKRLNLNREKSKNDEELILNELFNRFKENSTGFIKLEIYIFISNGDIDIKKIKKFVESNYSNESAYFRVLKVSWFLINIQKKTFLLDLIFL